MAQRFARPFYWLKPVLTFAELKLLLQGEPTEGGSLRQCCPASRCHEGCQAIMVALPQPYRCMTGLNGDPLQLPSYSA